MVTAFKNHVHADVVKNVQYIKEGDMLTSAAVYGVVPTNPDFLLIDVDGGRMVATTAYEKVERRKAGTMGRINKTTHKERYTATVTFNASDDNADLQIYCINESAITDNDTPSNSLAFVQSYKIAGTETFEQLLGCLPTRCNITIGSSGHIVYTVEFMVKQRIEDTSGPLIGTGSFDSNAPLTGDPWKASDGGADHFDWNSTAEALNSMTITLDRQYGKSSPTESIRDMFNQETIRAISGNVEIITRTSTLLGEAMTPNPTPRAMNIVLKSGSGGVTIAFTGATFENASGRDPDPFSADAWTDNFNFEAQTIAASIA